MNDDRQRSINRRGGRLTGCLARSTAGRGLAAKLPTSPSATTHPKTAMSTTSAERTPRRLPSCVGALPSVSRTMGSARPRLRLRLRVLLRMRQADSPQRCSPGPVAPAHADVIRRATRRYRPVLRRHVEVEMRRIAAAGGRPSRGEVEGYVQTVGILHAPAHREGVGTAPSDRQYTAPHAQNRPTVSSRSSSPPPATRRSRRPPSAA